MSGLGWSPEMRRLSTLGVLNPGLAYALNLAGLARVDASVSVLLWALEPVLILAMPVALCAGAALAGVVLVGSLVLSDQVSLAGVSATAWGSAIAAGAIYYGLAFWFYLAGLRGVSASVAGLFINMVLVFGITASYIVLGERLSPRQWIGAIVVIAAIAAAAFYVGRPESAEHRERVEA